MTNNIFCNFTPWQLTLMLTGLSCALLILWLFNPDIAQENNLIETSQSVFLSFSVLLHVYTYQINAQRNNTLENYLQTGLIIFCVAVLLREIDIDRWGNSGLWNQLELLLRGVTVISVLIYGYLILGKIHRLLNSWRTIIQQPMIRITMLGGIAYSAGWFFDKNIFLLSAGSSLFIEELLELNATALFVIGAAVQLIPERAQLFES